MLELKIENGDEENVVYIELLAAMSTWLHERIDTHNHFKDDMESYGDWLIETTKKWMSGYYEDLNELQDSIDDEFDEI